MRLFERFFWVAVWLGPVSVTIGFSAACAQERGDSERPALAIPISKIQEALIWTGQFDGFVDGRAGKRTLEAIKAYQRLEGELDTGALTEPQWQKLSAAATAERKRVGWTHYRNPHFNYAISYPASILPVTQQDTAAGVHVLRSDDGHYRLEITIGPTSPKSASDQAFAALTAPRNDRQITYSRQKDDWYVVTGEHEGEDFYIKAFHFANAEAIVEFTWPTQQRDHVRSVTVAIFNSISMPPDLAFPGMPPTVGERRVIAIPEETFPEVSSISTDTEGSAMALASPENADGSSDNADGSAVSEDGEPIPDRRSFMERQAESGPPSNPSSMPQSSAAAASRFEISSWLIFVAGGVAFFGLLILAARVSKEAESRKAREAQANLDAEERARTKQKEEQEQAEEWGRQQEETRRKRKEELLRLKNDIVMRRKESRPGLLTEWVNNQDEFPTADHIPISRIVVEIFRLYGDHDGLNYLIAEGLAKYISDDVHAVFDSVRAQKILSVIRDKLSEPDLQAARDREYLERQKRIDWIRTRIRSLKDYMHDLELRNNMHDKGAKMAAAQAELSALYRELAELERQA